MSDRFPGVPHDLAHCGRSERVAALGGDFPHVPRQAAPGEDFPSCPPSGRTRQVPGEEEADRADFATSSGSLTLPRLPMLSIMPRPSAFVAPSLKELTEELGQLRVEHEVMAG